MSAAPAAAAVICVHPASAPLGSHRPLSRRRPQLAQCSGQVRSLFALAATHVSARSFVAAPFRLASVVALQIQARAWSAAGATGDQARRVLTEKKVMNELSRMRLAWARRRARPRLALRWWPLLDASSSRRHSLLGGCRPREIARQEEGRV